MAVTGIQSSNDPYVIIKEEAISGFTAPKVSVGLGLVKVIFNGCNRFGVDDKVVFNKEKSLQITAGVQKYFMVDQKDIFLTIE